MRSPTVEQVQIQPFTRSKVKIRVKAYKKGFEVQEVKLRIFDKKNVTNTYLTLKRPQKLLWECELETVQEEAVVEILVYDRCGNCMKRRV